MEAGTVVDAEVVKRLKSRLDNNTEVAIRPVRFRGDHYMTADDEEEYMIAQANVRLHDERRVRRQRGPRYDIRMTS